MADKGAQPVFEPSHRHTSIQSGMQTKPNTGLWARLSARFDSVLLQAPVAGTAPLPLADAPADHGLQRSLQALCQTGPPFDVAHDALAGQPELRAQQQAWLQHQLLVLDGTLHMQQLGGPLRQRWHRLAIKLRETWASADAAPGGPWDCGLLNTGPAALARAQQFTPRRPTLMVAWGLQPPTLALMLDSLRQRQDSFAQPVRLWALTSPGV